MFSCNTSSLPADRCSPDSHCAVNSIVSPTQQYKLHSIMQCLHSRLVLIVLTMAHLSYVLLSFIDFGPGSPIRLGNWRTSEGKALRYRRR